MLEGKYFQTIWVVIVPRTIVAVQQYSKFQIQHNQIQQGESCIIISCQWCREAWSVKCSRWLRVRGVHIMQSVNVCGRVTMSLARSLQLQVLSITRQRKWCRSIAENDKRTTQRNALRAAGRVLNRGRTCSPWPRPDCSENFCHARCIDYQQNQLPDRHHSFVHLSLTVEH